MLEHNAFGRRHGSAAPARVAPPRSASKTTLSPEAEAFRARLASSPGTSASAFAEWRGSLRGRQTLTWLLAIAFLSPGLVSFLIDAPLTVSLGLSAAGFLVNGWLRRERKRRLAAIVQWEAADGR